MKWKLDDILKENEFDGLYKEIEKDGEELKKWVKKLSPKMSQDSFKKLLLFEEEIGIKMARLSYLPHLMEAVNQKNKKAVHNRTIQKGENYMTVKEIRENILARLEQKSYAEANEAYSIITSPYRAE